MHTSTVRPVEAEAQFCCGGQISGTGNPQSRFSRTEWVAVDFATKGLTVRSSSKLDTALGHGLSLPSMHYMPANED